MTNDLKVAHPLSGSSSTWFLVELEFWKCWFLRSGEIEVPGEKPPGANERNNKKLNPHIAWGASSLTTTPSFRHPLSSRVQSGQTDLLQYI